MVMVIIAFYKLISFLILDAGCTFETIGDLRQLFECQSVTGKISQNNTVSQLDCKDAFPIPLLGLSYFNCSKEFHFFEYFSLLLFIIESLQ